MEDVLLRGKYWRDTLSHAEENKDQTNVHGLKVVFYNPSNIDMSKKRFFACIHLHNALRNFGVRSALAVHIDISRIKHRLVFFPVGIVYPFPPIKIMLIDCSIRVNNNHLVIWGVSRSKICVLQFFLLWSYK